MKKFLAIYYVPPSALEQMKKATPEQQKAGMDSWRSWSMNNAKAIVDHGAPLGKTKRINAKGSSDIKNEIGAYTIVEADSFDAAAKLFENHPHFTMLPGGYVEVMEFLDMPGM